MRPSGVRPLCSAIVEKMDFEKEEESKLEISGTDETCLTFVIRDEDHTLGNALRYVLMKNPDVRFCGYSIPHPSENIMNIRVETYRESAADLFRKALLGLRAMSEHMKTSFTAELEDYNKREGKQ